MGLIDVIMEKRKDEDILLMTHQVLGYPSLEANEEIIKSFADNGISLVELQIPFSDPIADGPLFLNANQKAVEKKIPLKSYLDFIETMIKRYPQINFMIMTYFNILHSYGVKDFITMSKGIGVKGFIIPDIPIEYGCEFYELADQERMDAIPIVTYYTDEERLNFIKEHSHSFIYYVPRKGVTGTKTTFDEEAISHMDKVRTTLDRPIGVGFGIQDRETIEQLKGHSDIAIIGSKVLAIYEEQGIEGLNAFLKEIQR